MHHILILTLSDIKNDPRVSRQIRALSNHFALTVAGRAGGDLTGICYVPIIPRKRTLASMIRGAWLLKTGQFTSYYWGLPDIKDAAQKLAKKRFDLIIANDVEALPLALRVADGAKVLLDAHEYAPQEFEDSRVWSFFAQRFTTSFLCREHLPKIHAMMTVCEGIAGEYSRHFAVPRPFVILNAPYRQELEPGPCGEHIRMIHHGKAIPSRKIELMIDMMRYLDERFLLDFMMIEKNLDYLNSLKKRAEPDKRIRFLPPVAMPDIPRTINGYDIGLFLLPPTTLNYAHALPNKFFEFIQARLAVAIGPSPEMARYVKKFDCGIVASDFRTEQLATALNGLTREQIERFKQHSHEAAQELCFEASEQLLLKNVHEMLTT